MQKQPGKQEPNSHLLLPTAQGGPGRCSRLRHLPQGLTRSLCPLPPGCSDPTSCLFPPPLQCYLCCHLSRQAPLWGPNCPNTEPSADSSSHRPLATPSFQKLSHPSLSGNTALPSSPQSTGSVPKPRAGEVVLLSSQSSASPTHDTHTHPLMNETHTHTPTLNTALLCLHISAQAVSHTWNVLSSPIEGVRP